MAYFKEKKAYLLITAIAFSLGLSIFTYAQSKKPYDVTIVGTIAQESLPKVCGLFIQKLHEQCSINFIPTGYCNFDDFSPIVRSIAENPDKSPGKVAFLVDNLWCLDFNPSALVPNSPIKIAYSLIESTKLPPQWVSILNNQFDAVAVSDPYLVDVYINSGVRIPVFLLPIALDLNPFLDLPSKTKANNPFTFGISGAFWPRKNHYQTLLAFDQEFHNNPNVRLIIHGRGGNAPIINQIQSYIAEHQINNVYFLCGKLTDYQFKEYLNLLDAYVLASTAEGFSISPREAMARGIPCILSNNTAHITLCNSGFVKSIKADIPERADYLNSFGDVDFGFQFNCTVADIAQSMRDVYLNYKDYLIKAQAAREWVKQYSYDNLQQKFLTLVKPKKVIFGTENRLENDYLITNDLSLYQKYSKLLNQ